MKIYLVRHGQTDHNADGVYCAQDIDINLKGIIQAEILRDKIKDISYDIVISSPLKRAKHTANIINVNNVHIVEDERLKERDPGDLCGQKYETTNREEYWNYNTTLKQGSAEEIKVFLNRVHNFLNELKNKNYASVLIVAHSGVSKAFYTYFRGMTEDGILLDKGISNCELKEYIL